MPSFTHLLILLVIILVLTGKLKIPNIGSMLGKTTRDFKKALRGEEDIDVTHTVKRISDDSDDEKS